MCNISTCMHICTQLQSTHVYNTHAHYHTHTCTCKHSHTQRHTHSHTHTHNHTHTHVYTQDAQDAQQVARIEAQQVTSDMILIHAWVRAFFVSSEEGDR